jgi:acetyltransferase-like isoleucine patch superfamily enzyme
VADPTIRSKRASIAPDCEFGENVEIEADEIEIGPGCRIGFSGDDDFRTPPGVRIRADRLHLGAGVEIGRAVRIEGGTIRLDERVRINRHATIRVLDELHLGAYGTVGESSEISGRLVEIGQHLWMLPNAKIGGGSAFERPSLLRAGHYLHLGLHTLLNTARPVVIGHEVGLGTGTSIYTHGAYPSRLMGFPVAFAPVAIGDFTWVPGAIINPGVTIGRNCVIGVNSLVTRSIPDGALAAGSPAAVIKEGAYPRPLTPDGRHAFWLAFLEQYADLLGSPARPADRVADDLVVLDVGASVYAGLTAGSDAAPRAMAALGRLGDDRRIIVIGDGVLGPGAPVSWTRMDTDRRFIEGAADGLSERLANELRRHGVRFYSRPVGEAYATWEPDPPRSVGPMAEAPSS